MEAFQSQVLFTSPITLALAKGSDESDTLSLRPAAPEDFGWKTFQFGPPAKTVQLKYRFFPEAPEHIIAQVCKVEDARYCDPRDKRLPRPYSGKNVCAPATPFTLDPKCSTCKKQVLSQEWALHEEDIEVPYGVSVQLDQNVLSHVRECCQGADAGSSSLEAPARKKAKRSGGREDCTGDDSEDSKVFHVALAFVPLSVIRAQKPAACSALQRMLREGLCSDVTLRVGERQLRAHRCVLAANSRVFRSMFEHEFSEARSGVVDMQSERAEVVEAALAYLYGDDVTQLTSSVLLELLKLAEQYELASLKEHCEHYLAWNPSLDPLELLALADTYRAPILLDLVVAGILRQPEPERFAILQRCAVVEFSSAHPKVVEKLLVTRS